MDNSIGFATGEGDDVLEDFFEFIVGSPFDDEIKGGQFGTGSGVNFRLNGGGGDDVLTASTSNDRVAGGAGDDLLLTGSGDDVAKGGKGDDEAFAGKGTDRCQGVEIEHSCEI